MQSCPCKRRSRWIDTTSWIYRWTLLATIVRLIFRRVVQCESKGVQSAVQRCQGFTVRCLQTCKDLCIVQGTGAGEYACQLLKASCASYAKELAQLALCRSQLPEKRAYSWKLSRLTWLVWDHLDTVSRKCKTTGILRWADFTLSHYLDPSLPHFCHTMNEKWPTDSVSHFCAEREGSYPLLK